MTDDNSSSKEKPSLYKATQAVYSFVQSHEIFTIDAP